MTLSTRQQAVINYAHTQQVRALQLSMATMPQDQLQALKRTVAELHDSIAGEERRRAHGEQRTAAAAPPAGMTERPARWAQAHQAERCAGAGHSARVRRRAKEAWRHATVGSAVRRVCHDDPGDCEARDPNRCGVSAGWLVGWPAEEIEIWHILR